MPERNRGGMLNIDLGATHLGYLEHLKWETRKTKTAIVKELIERAFNGQIKIKPTEPGSK